MWACQQTADCCRGVDEVVMTHAERAEIERVVPSSVVLSWRPHEDSRFVRLSAKPCPLLKGQTCTVYPVRPMNCRRYGCVREDYSQPWDWSGPLNRSQRRSLVMLQRKAQRWGRTHDWPEGA